MLREARELAPNGNLSKLVSDALTHQVRLQRTRRWLELCVPTTVLAEVWRGGARSAPLARFLALCEVDELDAGTARHAGELLAATHGTATLDAVLVASAATRGDAVLTGDPDDVRPLAAAARVYVMVL